MKKIFFIMLLLFSTLTIPNNTEANGCNKFLTFSQTVVQTISFEGSGTLRQVNISGEDLLTASVSLPTTLNKGYSAIGIDVLCGDSTNITKVTINNSLVIYNNSTGEPTAPPVEPPPTDPEPPPLDSGGEKSALKKFIDNIFSVPLTFLELSIEKLREVGTVTAQGLNIGQYLKVFGDMPNEWQLVINSLLISMGIIGTLFMFRSIVRIYYGLKDGVKWW